MLELVSQRSLFAMSHWCLLLMSHWCLLAVTHWPQYIESDDSLLYRIGIINNSQYHCSSSTCFPTQANTFCVFRNCST